uniref:coiled-coil domain-containing protein n=1 Tax=Mycobacterium neglectum TaxID=242737 RepID=UPI003CCBB4A7
MSRVRHSVRRTAGGFAAGVMVLAIAIAGDVSADPAADALAKLDELSQQALQTREAVTAAQRDADDKMAAQTAAEDRQRADLEALDVANAQLATNQAAADRVAATTYISGRTGQLAAVMTAGSPQELIDQLSLQRIVVAETANQMKAYQAARERAAAAAGASEKSAADARAAAERSAAVHADLQAKWKELLRKITAAEARTQRLSPANRALATKRPALPPFHLSPLPIRPWPRIPLLISGLSAAPLKNKPHHHVTVSTPTAY